MMNRSFFRRLGCAMQILSVACLVVFLTDDVVRARPIVDKVLKIMP